MSGYSLDTNILIDALLDHAPAQLELRRIAESGARMWISRIVWIEVLSKGDEALVREMARFLGQFGLDELDDEISHRAAALRRQRPRESVGTTARRERHHHAHGLVRIGRGSVLRDGRRHDKGCHHGSADQ